MSASSEAVAAWKDLRASLQRLRRACLDERGLEAVEAIALAEVDELVTEQADEWDDKNRFRRLLTHWGLDPIREFAAGLVTKAVRKYLR